ncbi:MAG: TRAP transporter small permease subunit [Smithellaceae bacterium]|nr:TRAP transporter small permease subunit [Smithellaceae bacterium]
MKKFYEYVCKGEVFFVKVLLACIVGLVFAAAFTRTIGYPINWSVDMAVCLFAWCTFLGADVAMRNNKLMKLDFLINKLSPKNKDMLEILNLLIILLFLLLLIGFGAWLTYTTRFRTFQGIPGFSYSWVTLSVPVSGVLMAITTILQIRGKLIKGT